MQSTGVAAETQHLTFDENAASIVRLLLASRHMDATDLAPAVGMTRSTLYNRLNGKPWHASELDRIADYFGVPPSIFFQSVEAILGNQKFSLYMRPDLRLCPDFTEPTQIELFDTP